MALDEGVGIFSENMLLLSSDHEFVCRSIKKLLINLYRVNQMVDQLSDLLFSTNQLYLSSKLELPFHYRS